MLSQKTSLAEDVILRIDRVGSFRLLLKDTVTIGGPRHSGRPGHIALFSQLSAEHAELRRSTSGYSIHPVNGAVKRTSVAPALENTRSASGDTEHGQLLIHEAALTNNCRVGLNSDVSLQVRCSSPLCQSAVLEIEPVNRLVNRVEGIVLMDSMLILGPGRRAHIQCPHWEQSAVLTAQGGEFRLRSALSLTQQVPAETFDIAVPFNQYLSIHDCGLYLEPVGKNNS